MTNHKDSKTSHDLVGTLDRVQALIEDVVRTESWGVLRAIINEHLGNRGRFFRARLAIEGGQCLGVDPDFNVPFAAACELVHNASLIHDDVQDGDGERRGQSALWVKHGVEQAITAGDLLLMLPFLALDKGTYDDALKWKLSRCIAARAAATACGQAMEFSMLGGQGLDRGTYECAAQGKTGQLFAMSVEGANILAGCPAPSAPLAEAALGLGTVFQIQDDVVDLYGDKGRAKPGGDLREGKVSALVVTHLEAFPQDKEELLELLRKPAHETTDQEVQAWSDRFRSNGALEATILWGESILKALQSDERLEGVPALRHYLVAMGERLLARSTSSLSRLEEAALTPVSSPTELRS